MPLVLRPPTTADEGACRRLHAELLREGFTFLPSSTPDWQTLLADRAREAAGIDLAPGRVRGDWLVAEVDGEVVGRTSLRFGLNDFLHRYGGHVGYAVGRDFRRRGHATEILRQSLVRLEAEGIDPVLVTCDDDNVGSAAVIEACGGVLEDVVPQEGGAPKRRYWIRLS